MIPGKNPLRRLSLSKQKAASSETEKQKQAQERYFLRTVKSNPHYDLILAHLAQGTKPPEIAAYFAQQGWITVNERTFAECIRYFRRTEPNTIKNVELGDLDALVNTNQPQSDVIADLHQMLRVQKLRISIEVTTEKKIGKLFGNTHKEIDTFNKIAENIAKIEGKITEGGKRRGGEAMTDDVNENLKNIRKEETAGNRIHALTRQLANKHKPVSGSTQ